MAFTNSNDNLAGRSPIPFPAGIETISQRFKLTMATADLALNTVGNIGILPAGCIPVEVIFDSDDLDSNGTPTLAWSIGVSNGAVTNNIQSAAGTDISTATADGGAAWGTGITTSQAGGQSQVLSKALSRVTPVNYDRYIMLKATTAAATAVSGEVGVMVQYRAAY